MPHRSTALALVLALLLAAGAPAHAGEAPDPAASKPQASLLLQGKLGTRTATKDGEKHKLYVLHVGPTTYEIDTAGVEQKSPRFTPDAAKRA